MDACRPLTRMAKARAFVRPLAPTPASMFPQPWQFPSPPYYLVEGLENNDRRGGYASMLSVDDDGVVQLRPARRSQVSPAGSRALRAADVFPGGAHR